MNSGIFDPYTGLYFYSAMFEGNVALLAFAGLFLVFKSQSLGQRMDALHESMAAFAENKFEGAGMVCPAALPDPMNMVKELEDSAQAETRFNPAARNVFHELSTNSQMIWMQTRYLEDHRVQQRLRTNFKPVLLATILVILLPLVGMLTAKPLHLQGPLVEGACFTLAILFELIAILLNYNYVSTFALKD